MYIDESGHAGPVSGETDRERYLSLTGAIFEFEYVKSEVHPSVQNLKEKYFDEHPDSPIIFHRKDIIKAHKGFEPLRDTAVRIQFDDDLLGLLRDLEYSVISVCIDKYVHYQRYIDAHIPYHYCLSVLIEKYVQFLQRANGVGDGLAESRGGREDCALKDEFRNVYLNGTEFVSHQKMNTYLTSKELKVKPKNQNISGLQIADLLVTPSKHEILHDAGRINSLPPFSDKVRTILANKYDRNASGSMIYGKKFLS